LANTPKQPKIVKLSLLSPFFTYFETMPSKPSKDFVNNTLSQALLATQQHIHQLTASEAQLEPTAKRQKTDTAASDKYSKVKEASRFL